jgi:hypothetical protein
LERAGLKGRRVGAGIEIDYRDLENLMEFDILLLQRRIQKRIIYLKVQRKSGEAIVATPLEH